MRKKLLTGMVLIACMSVLGGCSSGGQKNHDMGYQEVPVTEEDHRKGNVDSGGNAEDNTGNIPNGSDADSLISDSVVQGHVVAFSDTGCIVSPQKTEKVDGGELASGAAPGYENAEDNVNIHYSGKCQFQYAKIDISTGKTDFSDASLSAVKKLTSLLVYGEQRDEKNIEAVKVFLVRYE